MEFSRSNVNLNPLRMMKNFGIKKKKKGKYRLVNITIKIIKLLIEAGFYFGTSAI